MPRWTKESKKKQAEVCRKTEPWRNATGPKTDKGIENCKHNATKHGLRSAEGEQLRTLMHQQRLLVNAILRENK